MNAILIRHTRIVVPPGWCYGHADVPLAESFPEEAAEVRAQLPWPPQLVLTSPALRCRKLAEQLAGTAPVREDVRLRELHMGGWEGRAWESFRGPESEAWALDPWNLRPPGGESAREFWARVALVREELVATDRARVAIVTHAGVIRAWRGIAEQRSFETMLREPVAFGSIHQAG